MYNCTHCHRVMSQLIISNISSHLRGPPPLSSLDLTLINFLQDGKVSVDNDPIIMCVDSDCDNVSVVAIIHYGNCEQD